MRWLLILFLLTSCASLPGWDKEQPTISRYPVKADRMFSFVGDLTVIRYASLRHLHIAAQELGFKEPFLRMNETGFIKGLYYSSRTVSMIGFVNGDLSTCRYEMVERVIPSGKHKGINIIDVCF